MCPKNKHTLSFLYITSLIDLKGILLMELILTYRIFNPFNLLFPYKPNIT